MSKKKKSDFVDPDDLVTEDNGSEEETEDEGRGGMMLEKEDIKLIHKALSQYKPTQEEEHLHGILLEQFEEILESAYVDVEYQ